MTTIKDIEKLYRASIEAHYNPNADDKMDERDQVPPSPPPPTKCYTSNTYKQKRQARVDTQLMCYIE